MSAGFPDQVRQLHSMSYHNPGSLPDGAVLVVGSGASGAQIAEELVTSGRRTFLCLSRHRRVPRRLLGREITNWLVDLGLMDRSRADWVGGRMPPTVLVTGVDGGHDLDLRDVGERGVTLLGSLRGVTGDFVDFADDAEQILAAADTMYDELVRQCYQHAGLVAPSNAGAIRPEPPPLRSSISLSASGISSVIWATGYDFDFDWLHAPVLDESGEPVQRRGISRAAGLYFLGLHWMVTFKSGTFMGIGDDADHVTDHLADLVCSYRGGNPDAVGTEAAARSRDE